MYSPFPVRCPRSGGALQAPLFALRPGLSRERVVRTKEITKERDKREERACRTKEKRRKDPRLHRSCGRHEIGCGQEQRRFPPSARLLGPRSLLLQPLPHLQLRHRAHSVILCLSRHPPSHIHRGEEVQYCPAAPPIGQEVPHLLPVLPPPRLLLHLRPQDLLLRLPLGALLEEVVPGLRSVPAPPALRGGPALCPVEILPGQAVPRLELVEPRGELLGAPSYHATGPLALRQLVLLLIGSAPHPLAYLHPLLLRDSPLEVGERSRERRCPHFCPAWGAWPLHPTGVRLPCCNLRPLIGLLIAGDSFVSWTPSDFDDDAQPSPTQRGDVLPRLEGIPLPRAQVRPTPST